MTDMELNAEKVKRVYPGAHTKQIIRGRWCFVFKAPDGNFTADDLVHEDVGFLTIELAWASAAKAVEVR